VQFSDRPGATEQRIRSEFEEMPCLCVTPDQARMLFGLPEGESHAILNRLEEEGFLTQISGGQYVRRQTRP